MSDAQPAAPAPAPKTSIVAPMTVSLIVLAMFGALGAAAYFGKDQATLNGMTEVVKNLVIMVVSYWIGSSVGSARKEAAITQPKQQGTTQ